MRAPLKLVFVAVVAASLLHTSSATAVPQIKFADLKSAIQTDNLSGIKDAGGKFGGFVVTDIPTVGYTDAVEDLVRLVMSRLGNGNKISHTLEMVRSPRPLNVSALTSDIRG